MIRFAENRSDKTAEEMLSMGRPSPTGLPPSSVTVLKLEMLLKGTALEFSSLSITLSFRNVRYQFPLSHSLKAAHSL